MIRLKLTDNPWDWWFDGTYGLLVGSYVPYRRRVLVAPPVWRTGAGLAYRP